MSRTPVFGRVPVDQRDWLPRVKPTVHFEDRRDERFPQLSRDPFFLQRCLADGRWYPHDRQEGRFYVVVPFDGGHLALVVDPDRPAIVLITLFRPSERWIDRLDQRRAMTLSEVSEAGA